MFIFPFAYQARISFQFLQNKKYCFKRSRKTYAFLYKSFCNFFTVLVSSAVMTFSKDCKIDRTTKMGFVINAVLSTCEFSKTSQSSPFTGNYPFFPIYWSVCDSHHDYLLKQIFWTS